MGSVFGMAKQRQILRYTNCIRSFWRKQGVIRLRLGIPLNFFCYHGWSDHSGAKRNGALTTGGIMRFFFIIFAVLLSGCFATPKGGSVYEPREHLGVGRAQPAVVVQTRLVRLAPDDRMIAAGGAIGGTLGGVAGAKMAGNSGRAGAFVGSVLGGIAGAGLAAQQTVHAHEIIVRMENGNTLSVVQRDGAPVAAGQAVWVIGTGANTRVVPR